MRKPTLIKFLFFHAAMCPLLGLSTCHAAFDVPLALDSQQSNQLDIRALERGEIELTTRGEDPFVVLKQFDPTDIAPSQTVLAFEYFSPEVLHGLTVYYGPPINSVKQFSAGKLQRAESWLPYAIDLKSLSGGKWTPKSNQLRIDFGRKPGLTLRIRNLRLRAPNNDETRSRAQRQAERQAKLEREARVNNFYSSEFPGSIKTVNIDETEICVRGKHISGLTNTHLIELRPEISIANQATSPAGEFILNSGSGIVDAGSIETDGFEVRLLRFQSDLDRSTSRFAIAQLLAGGRWKLLSHWKYATHFSQPTEIARPRQTPKGIKGMGGISPHLPLEELEELGVHNITVNMVLAGVMDAVPQRGWMPFQHAGRTWYVNPNRIAAYDKLTEFAAEHEIVVSGILLVNFSESQFGKMIVHPEADRAGHFAMPNFTNTEGVAAYEAVIEFLAQRYSSADAPHGRIANWIIHNEVGFGWEWTNMGTQPPMLYMDHYLSSMRLVHNVTRRYDPHSRVFISLTHHWNNPTEPLWKSYSNLDLLNRLVESTRLEGDFAWGVAYHPYPQSLRRADAWNDTLVTNDFDTPLITPKNIAVLDRWMHLPKMLDSAGNVRGLLLSEQGFNTPDYASESQRLQAAGFVYMWRQMKGLKSIEAFHNHRWVDSAGEGGLLLGLRKLPSDGRPFGDKKLSWEVYKALDTPQQERLTGFAEEMFGPK